MTATKPLRSCDECKYEGSWHFDDPDHPTRCPNYLAADLLAQAHQLTKEANERAHQAAVEIVKDAAYRFPEFSSNQLREEIAAAQIDPKGVMGAAFTAVQKLGLIEPTGRREMSNEPATRHQVNIWRSLQYTKGRRP